MLWQLIRGMKSIRESNGNLLDIATSEIGQLQVIKGVYLQIQEEMMTCTGHKIIQGEGLKYRVWPADWGWLGNYAVCWPSSFFYQYEFQLGPTRHQGDSMCKVSELWHQYSFGGDASTTWSERMDIWSEWRVTDQMWSQKLTSRPRMKGS